MPGRVRVGEECVKEGRGSVVMDYHSASKGLILCCRINPDRKWRMDLVVVLFTEG